MRQGILLAAHRRAPPDAVPENKETKRKGGKSLARLGAEVEATLGSGDARLEGVLARCVDGGGSVGLLLLVVGEEL